MANLKEQQGAETNALSQKEAVFMKHKKAISAAIVVVILIIAGVLSYETYISGPREQEASTALAKGQDYFANQKSLTDEALRQRLKGMGFGLLKLKSVTMKLSQFAKEMLELYTAEDN